LNTRYSTGLAFLAVASVLLTQPTVAQNAASPTLKSTTGSDLKSLVAEVKDARKQADVLNKLLADLHTAKVAPDWLKALNLQFKTFEPTSSGKNASLGVEYSYDKAVTDAKVFDGQNPGYLSFNLKARGNVSFDKNNNPADFLQSGGQFHLWQFFGQTEEDPIGSDGLTLSDRTFRELAQEKYRGKSGAELRATPEWQSYIQHAFDNDPLDFLYDATGNLSLESNQTFSKKQWAYGLEAHAVLRVWDPNSAGSKFNIFDWPFALTRMLGGEQFQPRGRFLPAVMAGIDLIDPVGNADRFKIDPDKSAYPRFKAEIGFRSKVVEIEGKPIWFNAGYRYFQELGASSAIQAANMDTQHYFTASLDLLWNVSVTYSVGKLPFDLKNQQVWALGYNVRF
jgi:hypothetical protein